jgi:hypothetical protein
MEKIYQITDKIIDYYEAHKNCVTLMAAAAGAGLIVGYVIGA